MGLREIGISANWQALQGTDTWESQVCSFRTVMRQCSSEDKRPQVAVLSSAPVHTALHYLQWFSVSLPLLLQLTCLQPPPHSEYLFCTQANITPDFCQLMASEAFCHLHPAFHLEIQVSFHYQSPTSFPLSITSTNT